MLLTAIMPSRQNTPHIMSEILSYEFQLIIAPKHHQILIFDLYMYTFYLYNVIFHMKG